MAIGQLRIRGFDPLCVIGKDGRLGNLRQYKQPSPPPSPANYDFA